MSTLRPTPMTSLPLTASPQATTAPYALPGPSDPHREHDPELALRPYASRDSADSARAASATLHSANASREHQPFPPPPRSPPSEARRRGALEVEEVIELDARVRRPGEGKGTYLAERFRADREDRRRSWMVFRDRFRGVGRMVGWKASWRAIIMSTWLNWLFIFVPFSWAAHLAGWGPGYTFGLSFVALVPMEKMLDYCGEQIAFYLGLDLGDLVVITLNNVIEAGLAIALLIRCETKLLQTSVVGVVLLHILFLPGAAFVAGGAKIREQMLHQSRAQLNSSLVSIGVLALLIPTAFYASINQTQPSTTQPGTEAVLVATTLDIDSLRRMFFQMSRGLAIILIVVYFASRVYLYNPPGDHNALRAGTDAPLEVRLEERELEHGEPEVNVWSCLILLAVTVTLTAVTVQFLVDSVEPVREATKVSQEWFGLVLLPIVSFSADGAIALGFFARYTLKDLLGAPQPPRTLAKARAIDLSIQFLLFWMPLLVLIGWWSSRELSLLFDMFEVAVLVGACFLVNYVTADARTNWAEGVILIAFYVMIALCAWYYPGEAGIGAMVDLTCGVDAQAGTA